MKLWLLGSVCAFLPAALAAGPAVNAEAGAQQAAAKVAEPGPDGQPRCGYRHTPDPDVPQLERLPVTPCVSGMAGIYPCDKVDLMTFMPIATIGGGGGSSLWGWTDPDTQREYAIMGRTNGTAFVDITDPANSVYLGNLPTHTGSSTWREMKTHGYYAYIVSEASGHGMQIFDLRRLRNVPAPPVTFTEDGWYGGFLTCHNIVINTQTGFAYAVGTGTCAGGLHMMSLANPVVPLFVGCFSGDGYTHDAQCVIYNGPDTAHVGKEICFNSNEDTLTIVDVTNKSAPVMLSRTGYPGVGYTHQGWLTPDHAHFLLDDETDETTFGHPTWTYIWNLADIDNPVLIGHYTGPTNAIDHNLFIHQGHAFEANYSAGLRILDIAGIATGNLTEVAFFDVFPTNNSANFSGAWNNYPFFNSGTVIVSRIGTSGGLFVLRPNPPVPVELLSFEVH